MTRRAVLLIGALFLFAGCSAGTMKKFTVTVDPPDAAIKVVAGDGTSQTYTSPAEVAIRMLPPDAPQKTKPVVEITKSSYRPRRLPAAPIKNGEAVSVKLEKIVRTQIKARLIAPAVSDSLTFSDKIISVVLSPGDQSIGMSITNQTQDSIRILWNSAEIRDLSTRPHRVMHNGVRFQDRNAQIPAQSIASKATIQVAAIPVDSVVFSSELEMYEVKPFFPVDGDPAGLKGKTFTIFIPVEIDRAIASYVFKLEILDVVRQ